MKEKTIILLASLIFAACAGYLFWVSSSDETRAWTAYFDDPKSGELDFIIENEGNKELFEWELLADDKKILDGKVEVLGKEKIIVDSKNLPEAGKITVEVSNADSGEKTTIYKTK